MAIIWMLSYEGSITAIYTFFIWTQVSWWYYATLYWLWPLLWIIYIAMRVGGDTDTDFASGYLAMSLILGGISVALQVVFEYEILLLYTKELFLAGDYDAPKRLALQESAIEAADREGDNGFGSGNMTGVDMSDPAAKKAANRDYGEGFAQSFDSPDIFIGDSDETNWFVDW
jgi:hypothetical protein